MKISADKKKALKDYFAKTRGYKVRSIKRRRDGNLVLFLKKPTAMGTTSVVITPAFAPGLQEIL